MRKADAFRYLEERKKGEKKEPLSEAERKDCYHLKWGKSIDCAPCGHIRDCYALMIHEVKERKRGD